MQRAIVDAVNEVLQLETGGSARLGSSCSFQGNGRFGKPRNCSAKRVSRDWKFCRSIETLQRGAEQG